MYENEYKEYGFNDKVPLIDKCSQMYNYFESKFNGIGSVDTQLIETTIENTIDNSMNEVNCKLCGINRHIEDAKQEIIEEVHNIDIETPCMCNIATKDDIRKAVEDINTHTDEKFKEIDFEKEFGDLNQQVLEIINKIN